MQSKYAEVSDLITMSLSPEIAQEFDNAAMEAQLRAASSTADNYLRSQFDLPLLDWDDSLRFVVCEIAAYGLFSQYGYNPNAPQDEIVMRRYKSAIAWLESVAKQLIFPTFKDSSPQQVHTRFVISNKPVGFARFNNCGCGNRGCYWCII